MSIYSLQRVIFFLVFSLTLCTAWTQENDGFIQTDLVSGDSISYQIWSSPYLKPKELSLPSSAQGIVDILVVDDAAGQYELKFTSNSSFNGKVQFDLKYFSGPSGQAAPKYISVNIDVLASIVRAKDDFLFYDAGGSDVSVDVLANDYTSADSLQTVIIAQVTNGSAYVDAQNQIVYSPDLANDFIGFVEYVVIDNLGGSDLGSLTIQSETSFVDTLRFKILNEQKFDVLLPNASCVISDSTDFGDLVVTENRLSYTPDADSDGEDLCVLTDGNDVLVVVFDVLGLNNPTDFVQDDHIYVAMNSSVSFDAFANDFDNDDAYIVDHSNPLNHDSLGLFSYTPSAWFQGLRNFSYTAYNGFENQTANVFVTVSNQVPTSMSSYVINGLVNEAIVLNYEVPLSDYHFEIFNLPSNGQLSVGVDSLTVDCNFIDGGGLITYQPGTDFVGTDEFDLRYFVNGQSASIVKITVDIKDNADDTLCHCIGPDCVWPGDLNNDGRIFVDDLLPLGLYMGETGDQRDDITYSHWYGQHGSDWGNSQGTGGADIKYVDANGDGIVTAEDALEIIANYNQAHALSTTQVLSTKQFGLDLINLNGVDTIYEGETLCLGLDIGSENNPVIDMHGLAFDLVIDAAIVDSSSLNVDFYENSWFTYNSSQLDMVVQPHDGTIHSSLTRSDGNGSTGSGVIGAACFIVEEDVAGIRGSQSDGRLVIESTEVSSMDSEGNVTALSNAYFSIPVARASQDSDLKPTMLVYPNPTMGDVNIALNGGSKILDLFVYDLNGQMINSFTNINQKNYTFDTENLSTGLYFVKARTPKGWVNKKFKVISE